MTQKVQDAAPFIQALSFAIYAMHARLIETGVLRQGEVSNALRAFDPGANVEAQMTAAVLSKMADIMDAHTFGPEGSRRNFGVIHGGKDDEPADE